MATHPKKAIPKTPMQAFAQAAPQEHIALLLWKMRHANPELAVTVTEADVKGYMDCISYLKVTPEVKVFEHRGATVIALLEKDTEIRDKTTGALVSRGNAIKPVENNEADFQRAEQHERVRMIRQTAPQLAQTLLNAANRGEFSEDLVREAAQALQIMGGPQP